MLWEEDELGDECNFVSESIKGCYVAHFWADWILGCEPLEVKGQDFPDLSFDNEKKIFSVVNSSPEAKSFYITIFHEAFGKNGPLLQNTSRDTDGENRDCITFIVVLEGNTIMDLCYIDIPNYDELDVYSHISKYPEFEENSSNDDEETISPSSIILPFPLLGENKSFLCSQGHFGQFTHFLPDFRCDVGTKVISVGDGEVVNIHNEHNVSGVNVKNLFSWNSIMIKISLEDKDNASENGNRFVYVEYVHIKKDSFTVKVGDSIKKGQIICESGDVGFCPEPHLHLQVHNTDSTDSPTINFFLLDSDNNPFIPKCGNYYP